MRIRAAVTPALNAPMVIEDVLLDDPGPGEALVRIIASGVCHTDAITRAGDLPMPLPGILGHEGAGVVEAVGDGVTAVEPGDGVVIGWPSCGECRHCRGGQPRYCLRLGEAIGAGARLRGPRAGTSGYRRADGGPLAGHFFGQSSLASHSLVDADALVPIPVGMDVALMGPLACGIATGAGAIMNTARPGPGASVVIYGAGAVGLAAVLAAALSPATRIVAVDRHASRLRTARRFGATDVVQAGDDAVAVVHEICGGPADIALECTGVIPVVRQAVDSVGMLETCLLIGGAPAGAEFAVDHLTTLWGKRIVGTLGGSGRSRELIGSLMDLYAQGRFPFHEMIEFFDLDQIERAMAASAAGEVLKPVIRMSP